MKVSTVAIEARISLSAVIAFLNSLPDDEIVEAHDIAKHFNANAGMLRYWARNNPKLSFHCFLLQGKYVYGNPKAIIALRKHVSKALGEK